MVNKQSMSLNFGCKGIRENELRMLDSHYTIYGKKKSE